MLNWSVLVGAFQVILTKMNDQNQHGSNFEVRVRSRVDLDEL